MHYTPYHGLASVSNWVKLKFAAMNLKKLALWLWKSCHPFLQIFVYCRFSAFYSFLLMQKPTLRCLKSGFFDRLKAFGKDACLFLFCIMQPVFRPGLWFVDKVVLDPGAPLSLQPYETDRAEGTAPTRGKLEGGGIIM